MDDLTNLIGSSDSGSNLIDRLMHLLDRQTDHKLNPHMLLGFLGMFNMLSLMNLVLGNGGVREFSGAPGITGGGDSAQSLGDTLTGLLKAQDSGQPDLMGLLSSVAGKKKINPALLMSLFSMLNQGGAGGAGTNKPQTDQVPEVQPPSGQGEKKPADEKSPVELKYDRKKEHERR